MAKKVFKRWTDEEISDLKEMYNEPYEILENHFSDRSLKSIKHKIKNMGLPRDMQWSVWSDEEVDILLKNYKLPQEDLQKLLPNRTWLAIIKTCFNMKLNDRPKGWSLWEDYEVDILKKSNSMSEAYEKLPHREKTSIRNKASSLGIRYSYWEEWEEEYLIENYQSSEWNEILKNLKNREMEDVYSKANKLGLKRDMGRVEISDSDVIELYNEGLYVSEISRELKMSFGAVKHRLNRNDIYPDAKILKGEEHPSWSGNTDELRRLRNVSEYYNWRISVFERDCYTCRKCFDSTGGNLEAHHILNFSSHPDGRYDIDNGITLCKTCHTVGKESFHSIYGTRNNNLEQLREFLANKL